MGMQVQTRDTRNKADEEAGKKQKKADLKKNISGLEDRLDLLQQEYRIKQIEKTDAVHCYARKRKNRKRHISSKDFNYQKRSWILFSNQLNNYQSFLTRFVP